MSSHLEARTRYTTRIRNYPADPRKLLASLALKTFWQAQIHVVPCMSLASMRPCGCLDVVGQPGNLCFTAIYDISHSQRSELQQKPVSQTARASSTKPPVQNERTFSNLHVVRRVVHIFGCFSSRHEGIHLFLPIAKAEWGNMFHFHIHVRLSTPSCACDTQKEMEKLAMSKQLM